MRFFILALFFCILANVFAWNYGDRVALDDDESNPEAVANRRQIAMEYLAREKFRTRIREEIAKEELEHKYNREKIRRAMEEFNDISADLLSLVHVTKLFFGDLLTNSGTELLTDQVLFGDLLTISNCFWTIFVIGQSNTISIIPGEDVRKDTEEKSGDEESHIELEQLIDDVLMD